MHQLATSLKANYGDKYAKMTTSTHTHTIKSQKIGTRIKVEYPNFHVHCTTQ